MPPGRFVCSHWDYINKDLKSIYHENELIKPQGVIMTYRKVIKASEVTGVEVKNSAGENLGKVNEVVIDKAHGNVSYLVLDFGGFLGFGNKFFAIPWNVFTYNEVEDCFMLDLNKEQLKDAPGFDKNDWPNFTSPNVLRTIEQFYTKHKKVK